MTKVKIDDTTRMTIEDNNYILEYKVPKGDFQGKKGIGFKWEIAGYFASVEQVLNDYVKNAPSKQNDGKIKELQDVIDCINEAQARINKLINKK